MASAAVGVTNLAYRATVSDEDFPGASGAAEKLRFLVNYAVLAPSGHNTQPWLFRIDGARVNVIADRTRALPVVDPYDRELTISCGAAIGMLEVAARRFGLRAEVSISTATSSDVLAVVSLADDVPATNEELRLFAAIRERQTNRNVYRPEDLPEEVLDKCAAAAVAVGVEMSHVSDETKRAAVAELVAEGDRVQFADPSFRRELASWVHSSRLGSRDGMSGVAFGMPDVLAPATRLVIRTFDLGDGVAAKDAEKIRSGSPVLSVLAAKTDDCAAWVNTGRGLASVLLHLCVNGLSASYLNQPIETGDLRSKLQHVFGLAAIPQILLRIGRSDERAPLSARRPVREVILEPS